MQLLAHHYGMMNSLHELPDELPWSLALLDNLQVKARYVLVGEPMLPLNYVPQTKERGGW